MSNTEFSCLPTIIGSVPLTWLTRDLQAAQADPAVSNIFVLGHRPIWAAQGETGPGGALAAVYQQPMTALLVANPKVVLYDGRETSKTRGEVNEFFMGEQNPILLVIPPLVLHGMKGVGTEPAYLINTPTEHYVYDGPDEHRVAPHPGEVPYDWNRKDG